MEAPLRSHEEFQDMPDPQVCNSARDDTLEVFLLKLADDHLVFFSEVPEPRDGDPAGLTPARGIRRWLERGYRALRNALDLPENEVGRFTRRLWDRLRRSIAPDEPMLRRLRTTNSIILHHPRSMSPEQASSAWTNYLVDRQRHHRIWLAVNLLVSPLSILLTPIPGPNVIGYWFVYRAICHALALIGVRRAMKGSIMTFLHASEVLDRPIGEESGPSIGARLDLNGLDEFVSRVAMKRTRPEGFSSTDLD